MKFSSTLLALVAGANAHTLMSEIYIDGEAQGDATCIRMPTDAATATDPVENLASTDMACGVNGMNGVARVCPVNGGSTMTFEFRDWPDDASKGSIDISHKGPCAVYLKKVDNATSDTAAGDGWFKILDDGYDESADQWCTEKVIANNGHLSVTIPESLQGGYYLIRSELLALHDADKGDPQFYIDCAQVFLQSSGSLLPDASATVSIPGYVSAEDKSVTFNIWQEPMALPYPIPGPAVWEAGSNGVSRVAQTKVTQQTEGLPAKDCVLTNGNWCGTEVSKYSTEDDCWTVSAACWKQCDSCYNTAPPTGSNNCKIWEDKCQTIDDQCNAGDFNGPPNYMKILTPSAAVIDAPAVFGDASDSGVTSGVSSLPSSSSAATTLATVAQSSYAVSSSTDDDSATISQLTSSVSSSTDDYAVTYITATSIATSTAFVTTTGAYPSSSSNTVSVDGSCGNGITCQGSSFGDCCSSHGWCGSDDAYCGSGCQISWGTCKAVTKREALAGPVQQPISGGGYVEMAVSTDGGCGGSTSCLTSTFGNCCGPNGDCGSDIGHCGYGCQANYGICAWGINRRLSTRLNMHSRANSYKNLDGRTVRKSLSLRDRDAALLD